MDLDGKPVTLTKAQVRASLLVKLVQLLKFKKNAQKSTVDFLLDCLNSEEEKIKGGEFFESLGSLISTANITPSAKEIFVLESPSHVF